MGISRRPSALAAPPGKQLRLSRAPLWAVGFTLLLLGFNAGADGARAADTLTKRLLPVSDEPLTQYRALRWMYARCERFDQEGWLEAWTEFDGRGFRYEIVSERGSERVRNKVLKSILKREQELIDAGQTSRSALTDENYEFQDPAIKEPGLRYVLLKPKRKDVLLINGRIVLTPDGRDLLRVEGRLAKNPSFWTSLVNVTRHYDRINGVRVPVATESIAKMKLAGLSRLEIRYEYETVNGRPVSLAAKRANARPRQLRTADRLSTEETGRASGR